MGFSRASVSELPRFIEASVVMNNTFAFRRAKEIRTSGVLPRGLSADRRRGMVMTRADERFGMREKDHPSVSRERKEKRAAV